MKYDLKILVFIYFYYFFANLTHFRLKSDTHFHQLSPSLGQNVVNLAQFVVNQSRDSSSWRHKSISLERGKPGNVDHFLYLLHNKQFTKQCYWLQWKESNKVCGFKWKTRKAGTFSTTLYCLEKRSQFIVAQITWSVKFPQNISPPSPQQLLLLLQWKFLINIICWIYGFTSNSH